MYKQDVNPAEGHVTVSEFQPQPAKGAELLEVCALLTSVNLPTTGVDDVFPANYVVVREGEELIGVAGFESYAPYALLRSLAVAPQHRSKGLGRKLVADRLDAARAAGTRAVYLLTTTAADFFGRLGFEPTSRENAPLQVKNSGEFASICPASAVFMLRRFD